MKRFAMISLAIGALLFTGLAVAQHGGGGGMRGGGSMGGGSMGGWSGGSHGGSWSGGSHGGSWGGSHGSWNGGWHGGGNWHGGWHGGNWHGSTVVVGFGGPWWGWWPGYWPYYGYYGGYYGGAYPAAYPYAYPSYGYGEYAPMYDSGAYVQRPDVPYQSGQQYQGGQVTSDGYLYYCPNPAGYYPQVPSCAAGWLKVVPQGAPGPAQR